MPRDIDAPTEMRLGSDHRGKIMPGWSGSEPNEASRPVKTLIQFMTGPMGAAVLKSFGMVRPGTRGRPWSHEILKLA